MKTPEQRRRDRIRESIPKRPGHRRVVGPEGGVKYVPMTPGQRRYGTPRKPK